MKRSPLKPGKPPTRKTRLKAKGKSRFPKRRDPKYCAWIRQGWCVADKGMTCDWSECAHVVSRGAGGADRDNTVPMCRSHHREQHRIGIKSFEQKYGLDLSVLALEYGRLWRREQQGETAA